MWAMAIKLSPGNNLSGDPTTQFTSHPQTTIARLEDPMCPKTILPQNHNRLTHINRHKQPTH